MGGAQVMGFGIKRNATDALFSDLVRERANWRCERCLTQYEKPAPGLHCSHFYGRGGKSTRWDFDNANALCFKCHTYLGSNPHEYRVWKLRQLGQRLYDRLVLRANTPTKIDEKMVRLGLKTEWKRIQADLKFKIIGAR